MDQRPCPRRRRRNHRSRAERRGSGTRDLRSTHVTTHMEAAGAIDVGDVLAELRRTFATGRTRGLDWRLAQLAGIERLCDEREAEIAAALLEDLGRPAVEAWLGDIASTKGEAAYARKHLGKWMRRRRQPLPLAQLPGRGWVQYDPLGVVLVI